MSDSHKPVAAFSVLTPLGAPGAVAIIQCWLPGPDGLPHPGVDGDASSGPESLLGLKPLRVGELRLVDLLGIDRGLAARFGPDTLQLMPHGGRAVLRALTHALTLRGFVPIDHADSHTNPRTIYPEAADELEARMLHALAWCPSPRAIDLLLDQPRRVAMKRPPVAPDSARALARLLHPPLIVAAGPSNIGKSTLLNTLAGRHVAIVADESGTTRDHVGARLDLLGLAVRYADTPGVREGERSDDEQRAVELALEVLAAADLVLLCADATQQPREDLPVPRHAGVLRVQLRSDRAGPHAEEVSAWADLRVCAHSGEGVPQLVAAMVESLVPAAAMQDQGVWSFWE